MKFCTECPLNILSNKLSNKCIWFGKIYFSPIDFEFVTHRDIPGRCAQDSFVVKNLISEHPLALKLAQKTLEKSLFNKDISLLLALLLNASKKIVGLFWQILKENESRSITLLNPIFVSSGLRPVNELIITKSKIDQYMLTISNSAVVDDI